MSTTSTAQSWSDHCASGRDIKPHHCMTVRHIGHDDTTGRPLWEFGAQGFGADAKAVADTVAGAVRAWNRDIRLGPGPVLTVRPATMRTEQPAARHVIDKQHSRIVLTFPGASS